MFWCTGVQVYCVLVYCTHGCNHGYTHAFWFPRLTFVFPLSFFLDNAPENEQRSELPYYTSRSAPRVPTLGGGDGVRIRRPHAVHSGFSNGGSVTCFFLLLRVIYAGRVAALVGGRGTCACARACVNARAHACVRVFSCTYVCIGV